MEMSEFRLRGHRLRHPNPNIRLGSLGGGGKATMHALQSLPILYHTIPIPIPCRQSAKSDRCRRISFTIPYFVLIFISWQVVCNSLKRKSARMRIMQIALFSFTTPGIFLGGWTTTAVATICQSRESTTNLFVAHAARSMASMKMLFKQLSPRHFALKVQKFH